MFMMPIPPTSNDSTAMLPTTTLEGALDLQPLSQQLPRHDELEVSGPLVPAEQRLVDDLADVDHLTTVVHL